MGRREHADGSELPEGIHMGDEIHVGNITGSQGVAIGPNASTSVTGQNTSGDVRIDTGELRAALGDLYDALGGLDIPREQRIAAQTATGAALAGAESEEVDAGAVSSSIERVGQVLQQADVVIEEGTSLWQHVTRLASLVGPLVGGAKVVAAWFGIPLP
jgi:hypothetical protein